MEHRRPPGWYPDRDDPTQVRHWNGRDWSGRHRALPAWILSDTDVAPDGSWGSLQPTGRGPVLEGPVRPTPLPAAARGALVEGRQGVRTQRLVRPARGLGRAGGPDALSSAGRHEPAPGWAPARRPLMIFVALVGVAVLMMGATVVGVGRVTNASNTALGRDLEFVTRATSICDAGLRGPRTPGSSAMTAPGDTAALVSNAEASSAAVGSVEQQLRALPLTTGAASAVDDWLDDLGRYVVDEGQLARTLDQAGHQVPADAGSPSVPTPAETAAMHVTADITQGDDFANANGLSACSLAPSSSSPLVPIP